MKTKHILTALALPAMFAACTADDIVSENNGMQKMPERALLSEDFVLNIDNGVESRYQVNGTTGLDFVFEANDSIGANLIDMPVIDVDDPADWTIVDYVAPALPFVNESGDVWKSAGRLGEGNYLFTNPYNPKDGGRLAAKVELPRVVQYSSENPNAIIEQYNKAVAADVIYEGDMSAKISLKNLYTYPKVRIHFANTEDVSKVTKVVLATVKDGEGADAGKKVEGDGFIYTTGLDHKYIAYMFDPRTIDAWLNADENEGKTEDDYWATKQTSHFILDGLDGVNKATGVQTSNTTTMTDYGKADKTPYLIYEMNESVVSFGKSKGIEVRLMLPSTDDFMSYNVIVYVCTDNGNYKFDFNGGPDGDIKFNDGTVPAKKKAALLRNTSNTLNTVQLTSVGHGAASDLNFGNVVTNVKDWNNLVAYYGDLEKHNGEPDGVSGTHTPLAVTILNEEFTFTEEAEMPKVAIFTIDKPVKVEGNVTLKNVRTTAAVTVKANSTLTTAQTFQAAQVNVEKGGNLVVTEALNKDKEVIVYGEIDEQKITKKLGVKGIGVVSNEGNVTVKAGAVAKFTLYNMYGGVLNVEAAASRAADAAGHAYLMGENKGLINNKGIITTFGDFTNHAPFEGEEGKSYEWDKEDKVWTNAPTIKNDGIFNAKSKVINYGMFENNVKLTSNFESTDEFTNDEAEGQTSGKEYVGTLKIAKEATTEIDDNSGVIVLADPNPTALKIFGETVGTIQYTLTDKTGKIELKESPVNYLIVTGNVDLQNTFWDEKNTKSEEDDERVALDVLEMLNGGSIKIAATTGTGDDIVETALVNTLIVKGNSTISGTVNSVSNIQIAEDVTLEVPVGARLEISDDAVVTGVNEKKGALQVNGTLKVANLTSDATTDETIADKQDVVNTMVTWGKEAVLAGTLRVDTSASDAATALQTAYNEALAEIWADYAATADRGSDLSTCYGYNPTDIKWFASELERYRNAGYPKVIALVKKYYTTDATYNAYAAKGNDEKVKELESKLVASNYTAAVDASIYWTTNAQWGLATNATADDLANKKANFKNEFITKAGLFTDEASAKIEQSAEVFKTEANAYKSVLAAFHKPTTMNGDNLKKYANVWQLISTDDIKAALLDEKAGEFGEVPGEYIFVWEECDLDKVVAEMSKYSVSDWCSAYPSLIVENDDESNAEGSIDTNEKLYTIEGVKAFLKIAALNESKSPVIDASSIATTYYSVSQNWEYSDGQVAALAGAHKIKLTGNTEGDE